MHLDLKTSFCKVLDCRALDSKIQNRNLANTVSNRRNRVNLLGGHLVAKARTLHLRSRGNSRHHLGLSGNRIPGEDSCSHSSRVANLQCDCPGVDIADSNNVLFNQVLD